MGEKVVGRVEELRAEWQRAWPASWHDVQLRAEMIDRHTWLHALSSPSDETGDGSADVPSWSSSTSGLAEQVVREEIGGGAGAPFAPVMALPGSRPLRVERSRPGWHLRGAVARAPWAPAPRTLLVAGLDEGDNAVLALVDVAARGVVVEGRGAGLAAVRFDDVAVAEGRVTHARDAGAALCDRLTVLALLAVIDEMDTREASDRSRADVVLCRAAVRAAVRSAGSGQPLARQHDVSAAAVVVLLACERLGLAAGGVGDLSWHRDRLAPLL